MKPAARTGGGLVYSTDAGRMCPGCRSPIDACRCRTAAPLPPASDVVKVSRETKGRAGKAVTLVRGLPPDPAALEALAKRLKNACGAGGTVKDGTIEIQGEHLERVEAALKAAGWRVKRAGG